MIPLAIALLMGGILGFAAHRAGICTVKAVAEVLTTGRGWFLWFFAQCALWVFAISAIAGMLGVGITIQHWPFLWLSVAGGVLFGLGATINAGCAFSTLSRTVDGNLNVAMAVLCWPLGMAVAFLALDMVGLERSPQTLRVDELGLAWFWLMPLFVLAAWVLWQAGALLRALRRAGSVKALISAPVYSLSAAAVLIGGAHGILVLLTGPWSFNATLLCGTSAATIGGCAQPVIPWLILLAALAGMAVSAWQRSSFRVTALQPQIALQHAVGGLIMGMGAALVPGGNDGLILFAIPSLSPHALPAYLALLLAIASAMLSMRAFGMAIPRISCTGDICRAGM